MAKRAKSAANPNAKDPDYVGFTDARYRPYALAIGQLSLAWNDLHESLGSLFCHITGIGDVEFKMMAAWQSLMADRAKRGMLKAAFRELSANEIRLNPMATDEFTWLFKEIDRLEQMRNQAIHSPLRSFDHPIWRVFPETDRPEGIAPDDLTGNRLAEELKGKNLLTHYRATRDDILALRDYADAIEEAWHFGGFKRKAWPRRPTRADRSGAQKKVKSKSATVQGSLPMPE
jgi:hypothetical protein